MSFKAIFELDGEKYRVLKFDYSLHQTVDDTGRPSSTVRGGLMNLVIESSDDTSLFEWMTDSYQVKEGKITFNKRDEDAKLKEFEFRDGYLVSYEESFDNVGTGAMVESLSISARHIKMGDGEHENEWVGVK